MVEFAYAIGRLRALEAGMLDENRIIRMVDAPDLSAAYYVLRELPSYQHEGKPFDFESLLTSELTETFDLLEKLSDRHAVIRVLRRKHAADLALADYLPLLERTARRYPLPLFRQYVAAFGSLQRLKLDLLEKKVDPETALARFRYTDLNLPVAAGLEEYRQSGSLLALEREIDNYLTGKLSHARYLAFGLEPLIGHAIAKEIEIKIVRLILTAKRLHVPIAAIKARLRLPYV